MNMSILFKIQKRGNSRKERKRKQKKKSPVLISLLLPQTTEVLKFKCIKNSSHPSGINSRVWLWESTFSTDHSGESTFFASYVNMAFKGIIWVTSRVAKTSTGHALTNTWSRTLRIITWAIAPFVKTNYWFCVNLICVQAHSKEYYQLKAFSSMTNLNNYIIFAYSAEKEGRPRISLKCLISAESVMI